MQTTTRVRRFDEPFARPVRDGDRGEAFVVTIVAQAGRAGCRMKPGHGTS